MHRVRWHLKKTIHSCTCEVGACNCGDNLWRLCAFSTTWRSVMGFSRETSEKLKISIVFMDHCHSSSNQKIHSTKHCMLTNMQLNLFATLHPFWGSQHCSLLKVVIYHPGFWAGSNFMLQLFQLTEWSLLKNRDDGLQLFVVSINLILWMSTDSDMNWVAYL